MVELRGFEPLTSSVQRRRSPGLSYSPTGGELAILNRGENRKLKRKHLNDWIVERTSP